MRSFAQLESSEVLSRKQLSPLKKRVLNNFEQDHIIEAFNDFDPVQQENLEDDLELLELDMIDLVRLFH